jgi:hypothetical protein
MFYHIAVEKNFIPQETGKDKDSVKNYLQARDRNDIWTELQGLVYGKYLPRARSYPGFTNFLEKCISLGHKLRIISHKTQFNVVGEKTDLRLAAMDWLVANKIAGNSAVKPDKIFFLSTREEKVRKISDEVCSTFIDDLPEVFLEPAFPANTRKILFRPESDARLGQIEHARTWQGVSDLVLGPG